MRIIEAIESYGYYKDWYKNDYQFLINRFGEDADLMAGLLAATSPRVSMKRSWMLALQVYNAFKAGKEFDEAGYMPAHLSNIKRVLSGESLSGPKVTRFYKNLMGDDNAVTLDTWMIRFLTDGEKETVSEKEYKRLERNFKRTAKRYGYTPAELQAIVWIAYRKSQGLKPKSYKLVGDEKQMMFEFMEVMV